MEVPVTVWSKLTLNKTLTGTTWTNGLPGETRATMQEICWAKKTLDNKLFNWSLYPKIPEIKRVFLSYVLNCVKHLLYEMFPETPNNHL